MVFSDCSSSSPTPSTTVALQWRCRGPPSYTRWLSCHRNSRTSMRRHDYLYAFIQHNLVASVDVSSLPSSSTPTTTGCIGTFFLTVLLHTVTVVEAFSSGPFRR
ncbi:hypothetical protein U9M48_024184 [Paspalum notatum var. saurae]|uniref:Uncharacterized protein n=1 Tax=Paspalum notatum var. saurae TaxID=547442 RepID=A0AAQ3TLS4_PASNO